MSEHCPACGSDYLSEVTDDGDVFTECGDCGHFWDGPRANVRTRFDESSGGLSV